jgi:hypothetical protein
VKRLLVAVIAALALASPAAASNWPDGRLDQIASDVAAKPVSVWCESSESDWIHTGDYYNEDWDSLFGFTVLSQPRVYINPRECLTLHAFEQGADVGSFYASIAMLTLTHESLHQRLNSGNEALVECNALKLLPDVAVRDFHVPATVAQSYLASVKKRVGGKLVNYRVLRVRQVPNPYLNALLSNARGWDSTLPDSYHGATC